MILTKKQTNFFISATLILFLWLSLKSMSEVLYLFGLLPFCVLTFASGMLAVTMRLFKEKIDKGSFLYTFLGCFNIALSIALIFSAANDKFEKGNYLILFIIPLLIGLYIVVDILFQKGVK